MAVILVRPRRLTWRERWFRMSVLCLFAAIIGALSAWLRPMIHGSVHYEAIVSMFILLPAAAMGCAWSLRRVPGGWVAAWCCLEVTVLFVVFTASWSLVFGRLWSDMVGFTSVVFLICCTASVALLVIIRLFRRPHAGPYCPACHYCLIGTVRDVCPECGRAFTLAELAITREELSAKA